jgi:hypothetical protein
MLQDEFESLLNTLCNQLTEESLKLGFETAKAFETRVREVVEQHLKDQSIIIDFDPHPQAFPDIAVGEFGIEVKFSLSDTWRSVANSVLERNRIDSIKTIYIVFGKMGGIPAVQWGEYEKCVMHVRTSHVPRFEVELFTEKSLFDQLGISYEEFRKLPMHEKMTHIRGYARGRLKKGERLWWLDDGSASTDYSLPIAARLYTELSDKEKLQLRAEAVLLCPQVVKPSRSRNKYDDVALYLLTYHGVLAHQTRDLFSAGSVSNPGNDDAGGLYIERALKLLEPFMLDAALRMDGAIFVEYWGKDVQPGQRIKEWLLLADANATDWIPSQSLFKSGY